MKKKIEILKKIKAQPNGRIFSVSFIKKDGTERIYNCTKLNKKSLKGGQRSWNPEESGRMFVYENNAKGWRTLDINTINWVQIDGQKFTTK